MGSDFETAWEETRQQVVFTTHTPVMAENEVYDHDLSPDGSLCWLRTRSNGTDGGRPFNLTLAGLRLSHMANGVSRCTGLPLAMWRGSEAQLHYQHHNKRKTWQNPQIRQTFEVMAPLKRIFS